MKEPKPRRPYKKRGAGFLRGLYAGQKEHRPDLTTDIATLRDAVSMQSQRAVALHREVMSQAPTVVPLRKKEKAA